jgi:hypothetical protein
LPTVLKYQDTNENTLTQEEDSNTPLHPTKKQKQKQTNNKQPKNKQSKAKQNKNIKQETKNTKNYNKNNNVWPRRVMSCHDSSYMYGPGV